MSDQPAIDNQQVCPLCNSANFFWDEELGAAVCHNCWKRCYPDDYEKKWHRCHDCDFQQWASITDWCVACGSPALKLEEGFLAVLRVDRLPESAEVQRETGLSSVKRPGANDQN